MLADHADILPPGDHHEADEDSIRREHAGYLDVGEVAKVLEAALKHLGDEVRSEKFPAYESKAESVSSGKLQGHDKQFNIKLPQSFSKDFFVAFLSLKNTF